MATDGGDSSSSVTRTKSGSSAAGGASKKDSNSPGPLVAPPFLVVDRGDPLMPEQLRRHELTVQEALQAHQTIIRVARNPGQEPSWPMILGALRQAEVGYGELNIVARAKYEKQRRFRDLTAGLDMSQLINIRAADEAEGLLQDSWLVWRRVFSTYLQIHLVLKPNDPLPTLILEPPTQPDPRPSLPTTG